MVSAIPHGLANSFMMRDMLGFAFISDGIVILAVIVFVPKVADNASGS
jgi:hypothetical protein